jgi:nucleotide-binding universal stress UspA family protein
MARAKRAHVVCAFWGTSGGEEVATHETVPLQVAEWQARRRFQAEQVVAYAAAILKNTGLDVSWEIRAESPKSLLLTEARNWLADCIFVGATGSGQAGSINFLAVPRLRFVMRAVCSVEVVRNEVDG